MHIDRDWRAMVFGAVLLCGSWAAGCDGGSNTNTNNQNNLNNTNDNQPVCGDGLIEGSEQCEGTNLDDATCETLGFGGGPLGCLASCLYDTSSCNPVESCGDGVQQAPEECDTLDLNGQTCESLGQDSGTLSCQVDCQFNLSLCNGCGDGVIGGTEECDDGTDNSDTVPDACRTDCRLARCGDGTVDSAETCDGTVPGSTTCQGASYDGGVVTCDAACNVSYVGCTTCGNALCEIGEAFACPADCTLASVSAGGSFSCANKVDGTVWCWGYNGFGQLGDGLTHQSCSPPADPHLDCSLSPVQVPSLSGVVSLRSKSYHSFAVLGDTTTWTWGDNEEGQLGTGVVDNWYMTPVQVTGLTDVADLGTDGSHSCAVKTDGTLWCWGSGGDGMLGLGDWASYSTPQQVPGLQNMVDVAAGFEHTCAVRGDGAAFCWGSGFLGQLGDGLGQRSNTPVQVTGLPPVVAVTVAWLHSCALESSGQVWCWGADDYGQLGTNQTYNCPNSTSNCSLVPVPVTSLTGVARLMAGGEGSTCALKWDGTIWCWGDNFMGQLGDGTTTDHPTPVQVLGLTTAVSISMGYSTTCAVDSANQGWCWGSNYLGELGDGTQTDSATPVAIQGL